MFKNFKKATTTFCAAALILSALCVSAGAAYDAKTDYMQTMIISATTNNTESGITAQNARNEKIKALGLDTNYAPISFEDLHLLSKVIYAEAGSEWLSDEWKLSVGEVVLNRRTSPEFPNTISEVIYQRGQYYAVSSGYFQDIVPSERCVRLALRLLEGERVLNDASVVFQSNFPQGSGIYRQFWDQYLGTTYFCHSSYPALYL